MPNHSPAIVPLLARICLCLIFLLSAANHLMNWNAMVQFMIGKLPPNLVGGHAPLIAQLMLAGAITLMIVGGLSVLFGFYARWGAILLILFVLPAAILIHNFWVYGPGDPQRPAQMTNFLKNIAIAGGLLLLSAYGPGRWSIDAARRRPST
ncbi:MAG: DoxX family protein [Thermoguttaceae bacterium]